MNTTVDAMLERLQALLGDLDFTWDERALDSPEIALKIGERYNREFERLEAMGEEKEERIFNLMFSFFALMLQTLAIRQYGNDGITAIRKVVAEIFDKPNVKAEISRQRNTIEKALLASTLTKDQVDLVMVGMIDEIPSSLVDGLSELYAPYRLLPLTEAQSITTTLSDMMKEAEYADDKRVD